MYVYIYICIYKKSILTESATFLWNLQAVQPWPKVSDDLARAAHSQSPFPRVAAFQGAWESCPLLQGQQISKAFPDVYFGNLKFKH